MDTDTLHTQIAVLKDALGFYADERRYHGANNRAFAGDRYTAPDAAYMNCADRDRGEIARRALKEATWTQS